eukprot:gene9854-10865_t
MKLRKMTNVHENYSKEYCDVLGWESCKACQKEIQKEASTMRMNSQAESFISSSNERYSILSQRLGTCRTSPKSTKGLCQPSCEQQEDNNVDILVRKMFPMIYNSMVETSKRQSEAKRSQLSVSRENSDLSISTSISSILNEDEREMLLNGCLMEYENISESSVEMKPVTRRIDDNIGQANYPIDYFENDADKKRLEIPEKSIVSMARRSSTVGKHIRKRTAKILEQNLEKWQPISTERYPRISKRFVLKQNESNSSDKRIGSKEKRQQNLPNVNVGSFQRMNSEVKNVSIEPIRCEINYIKNRWKDEALFNENPFAIQLDVL